MGIKEKMLKLLAWNLKVKVNDKTWVNIVTSTKFISDQSIKSLNQSKVKITSSRNKENRIVEVSSLAKRAILAVLGKIFW
jgi:hypothetical protein